MALPTALLALAAASAAAAMSAAVAPSPVFTCAPTANTVHSLTVFSDGGYAVNVAGSSLGSSWFSNGTVAARMAQQWYASSNGGLALQGAGSGSSGNDGMGAFTAWSFNWKAVGGGAAGTALSTTFKCYDAGMLVFELAFPTGASGTNGSYVTVNTTVGPCYPSTMFPSFPAGAAVAPALGADVIHLQHSGPWTLNEVWGQGVDKGFQSCLSTPLYLLDPGFYPAVGTTFNGNNTKPTTVILSPMTHFHATVTAAVQDPAAPPGQHAPLLAQGLASTVTEVPAGYTVSVGLFSSSQGWNDAVQGWGGLMQAYYGTTRLGGGSAAKARLGGAATVKGSGTAASAPAPAASTSPSAVDRTALTTKLSYWTDNGAVYFQGWWDKYCPTRNCSQAAPGTLNPEQTMMALKEYHTAAGLPVGIYQLDTWWFYQQGDVRPGGSLDCVDWRPRDDMWPNGLPYVTQQAGGIPLLLYSWGFVTPQDGNLMTNWTWETSLAYDPAHPDTREGMVILDQVYDFYSMIRDRFLTYNGTSMEEDNMGLHTMSYGSHLTAVDGVERWWAGFATPWCESAIPMQICESNPADILESLKYPCITNSRDNIDNVPGNWTADNYFSRRWHVGFDRPFLTSLGIQPFYDNVWTTPSQPASSWAGQSEEYLELAWILSVLSAGPVGFSDQVNNTNATLVMTCCAADGTLLKPSTPSAYLDLVYLPQTLNPINVSEGRLFQAHSWVSMVASSPSGTSSGVAAAGVGEDGRGPASSPSAPTNVIDGAQVLFRKDSKGDPPTNFIDFPSLLAVDVAGPFPVLPAYFTPDLSGGGFVGLPWTPGFAALNTRCCNGCPAASCLLNFSTTQPITVATGVAPVPWQHRFEYYSLSPVLTDGSSTSGWALIGEVEKVVRVSPMRFSSVGLGSSSAATASGTASSFTFTVSSPGSSGGSGGETVDVAVLAPVGSSGSVAPSIILRMSIPFTAGDSARTAGAGSSAGGWSSVTVTCSQDGQGVPSCSW